jgi:hypothetical protein
MGQSRTSPIVERFGESSRPHPSFPPISNNGITNGIIGSGCCHYKGKLGPATEYVLLAVNDYLEGLMVCNRIGYGTKCVAATVTARGL